MANKFFQNTTLVASLIAGGAFSVVNAIGGNFSWINLAGNFVGTAGFFVIGDALTGFVSRSPNILAKSVAPAILRTSYTFALIAGFSSGLSAALSMTVLLTTVGVSFAVFLGSRWAAERLGRMS